jgi:trans-2,3-dihydro-3-hydroxyanthranilate isomerase
MRRRTFFTLDVFASVRGAGNPLAVVIDGDDLSDDAMQSIARDFNLSETVFVQPARDDRERAFLRIFTPGRELPFAGHPTVGTAVLMGLRDNDGATGALDFVLGEKVGPVTCHVEIDSGIGGSATFILPKLPERLGAPTDHAALAEALGVEEADIGSGAHAPSIYSAGVPFPLIPLRTRAAVDRARIVSAGALAGAVDGPGDDHVFLYCAEPVDTAHHFHARMLAPGFGVAEDPATGAAAAALAGAIMAFGRPGDGRHRFTIEQGYAMGRPSQIGLTLDVAGGLLTQAAISGAAVIATEGLLTT